MEVRRISPKLHPNSPVLAQQRRREKALEDQKRRRASKVDASRNLDALAGLTLGADLSSSENETEIVREGIGHLAALLPHQHILEPPPDKSKPPKKVRKSKSRYAEKCMYAELLEFRRDQEHGGVGCIPPDLESNWIALAPIPKGKRCLAVANLMNGNPGIVPTSLHSRLKGKIILSFPSPLPADTILDCILDDDWKNSGILHVLDVIRWHGQDVADGECAFRFWWRDARLSEIPSLSLPSSYSTTTYEFPYPTTFLPVPSHAPLTLSKFLSAVIPAARTVRTVTVPVMSQSTNRADCDMEIDPVTDLRTSYVKSDGLLLYDAGASYEPGTSPLSLWVPNSEVPRPGKDPLDILETAIQELIKMPARDKLGQIAVPEVNMGE